MSNTTAPSPLPHEVLEAAARWYVHLNETEPSASTRAAWEQGVNADSLHRRAWERMEALERRLASVPSETAAPTLERAHTRRRHTVKLLVATLSAGTLAALFPRIESGWRVAQADHRTRTGERSRVQLVDGGTLDLNSATSVNLEYGATIRRLRLLAGEILVQTAPDPQLLRPFEVLTAHGTVRALGTRFSVRLEDGRTRVAVLEHAVELRPAAGAPRRVEAGELAGFTPRQADTPSPLPPGEGAWHEGRLIAVDRRLDDFLADLARHRPGAISCAPEVAGLRLSGAFRLADTDAVLDTLAASLPVRLRYLTRYWVRVEPA